MKKITTVLFITVLFALSSCVSVKLVGKVNMISNRNVESAANYTVIKNYMGASDKELRKSRATSIEEAIDNTVKNTAGGEFLKNVKIYSVEHLMGKYFAVEGDVWGVATNMNIRGWKVGDKVQWIAKKGKISTGVISDLKNANECTIKQDETGVLVQVSYDKLDRIQ